MSEHQKEAQHLKAQNTPMPVEAAAKYLGVHYTTLNTWRCRGGGPKFLRLGRAIRYRPSDLEEFMEQSTRSNTSKQAAQ